jgi:hypothetical protein
MHCQPLALLLIYFICELHVSLSLQKKITDDAGHIYRIDKIFIINLDSKYFLMFNGLHKRTYYKLSAVL